MKIRMGRNFSRLLTRTKITPIHEYFIGKIFLNFVIKIIFNEKTLLHLQQTNSFHSFLKTNINISADCWSRFSSIDPREAWKPARTNFGGPASPNLSSWSSTDLSGKKKKKIEQPLSLIWKSWKENWKNFEQRKREKRFSKVHTLTPFRFTFHQDWHRPTSLSSG